MQIVDAQELIATVFRINPSKKDSWELMGLCTFFDAMQADRRALFFSKQLPMIAKMALELPQHLEQLEAPVPLLLSGHEQTVSVSRQLVASLMALAFFCALPVQGNGCSGVAANKSSLRVINFAQLYQTALQSAQAQKLHCLIHYLHRVASSAPSGLCTLQRVVVDTSEMELTELAGGFEHTTVTMLSTGCIEETASTVHVSCHCC